MLARIKQFLKSIPPLRRLVVATRRALCPLTTEDVLQWMVEKASHAVTRPVFVKVGANDGVSGDPFGDSLLTNRPWTGVLVEPVPYCIARLRNIYSDTSRFTIDTSAVGDARGKATFYYVSEAASTSLTDLPAWWDQLGSFDRAHIVKHVQGRLEPFIVTTTVDVKPLRDILRVHKLPHVTLLHIDTEGFDLRVLKSLGLPALCPSWIMIEHHHMTAPDRAEMLSILQRAEYDVFDTSRDFFAMHRGASHGLHADGRVGRIFRRTGLAAVA